MRAINEIISDLNCSEQEMVHVVQEYIFERKAVRVEVNMNKPSGMFYEANMLMLITAFNAASSYYFRKQRA
jgi:hypothetical protein